MKHALLFAVMLATTAWATELPPTTGTQVDFHVEVQRTVANDLGQAVAYAEVTGNDPADTAKKIKSLISDGLATAKSQPGLTVKSGNSHTWPVYGKNNRSIEGWRMRSEIILESRDAMALSAAVGKLQSSLAVGNLSFTPAPETRRKAEEEATIEAIDSFNMKAARIAATMKKSYRIRQMTLNGSQQFPRPYPMARGAMLMATEAAPMPVEAGESSITVVVSGRIELAD